MLRFIIVLGCFFSVANGFGALPILPTGKANLALGDPLNRIQRYFPQMESMSGSDQNGTFIEAYRVTNPDFVNAKEVWFILDQHILTQIDYVFSSFQFKALDSKISVERHISDYFGSAAVKQRSNISDPQGLYIYTWHDPKTDEKASLDFLASGDVRISFFLNRVNPLGSKEQQEKSNASLAIPPARESSSSIIDGPAEQSEQGAALDRALKASRPPNGTIFLQTSTQGRGELTIDNGSNFDALVKLVSPQRKYTFISVYIHAGRSATVTNIRPNSYKLIFALGEGWDESRNAMVRIASTAAFEKLLTFVRSQDHYTSFKVTLHPVVGGNTQTAAISKEDFLAY
jgi:hypothetical protein